ncbi:M13 family metallopeptidase [Sedimentitalea sp. JM2-8]|uniref:M13 family metallopeptidase n=1 Tax=Sedimentitalea xiamensis TaxID=3050037 RepID=A0ABT7FKV3_9RHOB|nr:M13 family metallopeptidase [Sedimentitalea xiamensis]MDK3075773.1 M13 family metallopeptidase [Sedimentitalea xiamensis]
MVAGAAAAQGIDLPELGPDDLLFSVLNMDLTADPKVDFYRFAAGGWLDRVERPATEASYNFATIQQNRITQQIVAVVAKAVEGALEAPKGSPTQQVGDFFAAILDVEHRNAQGMAPLQDELDRIAAIASLDDLTRYSAHFLTISSGTILLGGLGQSGDLADSSRYAIYQGPGEAGIKARDVYTSDDNSPRRMAYRAYVNGTLMAAGYDAAEAERVTNLVLDLETALDAVQLTDAEKLDFNNINNRMSFAEAKALAPNFDGSVYLDELGMPLPEEVIVTQPDYFRALSQMLAERPLEDFKDYARFRLINKFATVLSTDFEEPQRALSEAFSGVPTLRPLAERVLGQVQKSLGHPLGHLYVDAYYDEATREKTFELIGYIVDAFAERVPSRDWISDATKAEALAKLEAFDNKVGYPETWIDYTSVEIVPDDPVANLKAVSAFEFARELAKLGGPVVLEDFNAESTLPVTMNASYNIQVNGFQITAAISQPPAFQPDADPAVRFCRFGGVIGHEATHGFDTLGRQFDADGNLRNWWTDEDTAAFIEEAKKLVAQTAETELVPGHAGNGALWVTENMADVGGIKLGYTALMNYLADHPEENVEVDGFTQAQRCFIAWAQLWAENAVEPYLINVAESGDHPPNIYRTTAPLLHFDAFYEAFGIEEGDPMWLPPEKRVNAW